jgi:hypothetical protein
MTDRELVDQAIKMWTTLCALFQIPRGRRAGVR